MKRTRHILASLLSLALCVSALNPAAFVALTALWRSAPAGSAGMGAPAPRFSLNSQSLVELRADRSKQAPSFQTSPTLLARTVRSAPPVQTGRVLRDNESRSPLDCLARIRLARAPPRFHS